MPTNAAVDILAGVLDKHRLGIREWSDGYRYTSCMCPVEVGSAGHSAHVAVEQGKALSDAGMTVVTQPVHEAEFGVQGWRVAFGSCGPQPIPRRDGRIRVQHGPPNLPARTPLLGGQEPARQSLISQMDGKQCKNCAHEAEKAAKAKP